MDAMQECKARQLARRESPEYKPFVVREQNDLREEADRLTDVFDDLRNIAAGITPGLRADEFANALETIEASLPRARPLVRDVRKAAKLIVARREREEKGVFRP